LKVYITADIEGITGIAHWDEASKTHADYGQFRDRMTQEVGAACEGALEAGATEVWIKDAHGSGRNLIADRLPEQIRLIRGWSGHPYSMVQELDSTFEALVFVGYHSAATAGGNPLSHTFSGAFNRIELNGERLSEFRCNSLTGRSLGIPSVFLSGDEALCKEAQGWEPEITTVVTQRGVGRSTISIHPARSLEQIREGAARAIQGRQAPAAMPGPYRLDVRFREHMDAYRFSFYPGAVAVTDDTTRFETDTWFEVLRALRFAR
jgi:D-amino peptidase